MKDGKLSRKKTLKKDYTQNDNAFEQEIFSKIRKREEESDALRRLLDSLHIVIDKHKSNTKPNH